MGDSESFVERLQARLDEFSDGKIDRLWKLLQQNRKGEVMALDDAKIQAMQDHVDFESSEFEMTEDYMEELVKRVRSEDHLSEIHRFDVKQIVDWVVTLDDEEFECMLDALVPVFVDTFPNFVEALTADQMSEAWPLLWPRVKAHFKAERKMGKVLSSLYSSAQIGKAIKIMKSNGGAQQDDGDEKKSRRRRPRRNEKHKQPPPPENEEDEMDAGAANAE